MSNKPNKAFILAAGFGTRMKPLTDTKPKPMVEVAGRSLIWRSLDKLKQAGIKEVVVNMHYLADVLKAHLKEYTKQNPDMVIHLSFEEEILDTGGGVKKALHFFKDQPFFVIAGDALWSDGMSGSVFQRLIDHWDPKNMDIITLLQPVKNMELTHGVGDFDLGADGLVHRSHEKSGAYMWTNIRLNSPEIYRGYLADNFSFLEIMDLCESKGSFYALEHDGQWHHVSTPEDLETVDSYYRKNGEEDAA